MKRNFILFFTIILLAGCALYSKPKVPTVESPPKFKNTITVVHGTNGNLYSNWWEKFADPTLNQLEKTALQNNFDYAIALKNIQIAKTYITENSSYFFPQINVNANSSHNAIASNSVASKQAAITGNIYNLTQLYGAASYELDLWHQIANGVNWAKANVGVSEANSNIIKLTLVSNVANTYFQLNALNANLDNLHKQLDAANQIVKLNATQYKSGLENVEPFEDAKIQLENIKSNINNLEKQREITQNTLAYLVGQYPEQFKVKTSNVLQSANLEKFIPQNLPSQMLSQRPDIQAAFYQILAYGYLKKQVVANFLPNFSLTGTYGYASTGLRNFVSNGNLFAAFGLNILQPLFNYGQLASEYNRARLQYESAILNYKNTIINAFKEVDNALASYQQDSIALRAFINQLAAAKVKLDLAQAQYQAGTIDQMTYQTYRLSYLQNEYNLINQTLLVYQDLGQVYQVLGLGM